MTKTPAGLCHLGMVGLGVMGRNLLLNIASKGFSVLGYDNDPEKIKLLEQQASGLAVYTATTIKQFIAGLKPPRSVIILVPAGIAVDAVVNLLLANMQPEDLIIDAGNSHFEDTNRRITQAQQQQIYFMGVGISGGEAGARFGPSIMPGGAKKAYTAIQPIFEAIAAQSDNHLCVAYLGQGSVGHFVKMVHNGIEYALMQLIAETYDLMKRFLGFDEKQLSIVYQSWNNHALKSYLFTITSEIFKTIDPVTKKPLIDVILPIANQKGTGMWTSKAAMQLQVPTPTIDWAVAMRDMSTLDLQRQKAAAIYSSTAAKTITLAQKNTFTQILAEAFYCAQIITFAQGFSLLKVASDTYQYELNLAITAKIWRGGCIIRSEFLKDIQQAFTKNPVLENLLLNLRIAKLIDKTNTSLRQLVIKAIEIGIPTPAFAASLHYFDAYRSAWQPANLIQAQRDYFGSHTYQRSDMPGIFHTQWS